MEVAYLIVSLINSGPETFQLTRYSTEGTGDPRAQTELQSLRQKASQLITQMLAVSTTRLPFKSF